MAKLSQIKLGSTIYDIGAAWGNISGKPSSFPPSSHTHDFIMYKDTRSDNQSPDDVQAGLTVHLKGSGTDGLSDGGSYHAILNVKDWGDYSGGPYWQSTVTANNNMYFRRSTAGTTWGSWQKILSDNNYTNYTVTKTGAGASGTWGISITGSAGSVAWGNVTGKPSSFTPSSHTHNYIAAKGNYTFNANTLPNSFDLGVSAGFVNNDSGFGNYGSVLTARTYSGGGGTLQLYAPYSPTYGGTRLKARFGNYDSGNGNSWTDLKELAWTSDLTWANITGKPSAFNPDLPLRLKNYSTSGYASVDDATEQGFHYITGATSRPSFSTTTATDYRVLTTAYSSSWLQQIATDFRCNDIFYRRRENGTWKSWVQIQTTESADARYAKLASPNNLVHSSNEITMVPDAYSGDVYLNYRTASGNTNGAINTYRFCKGNGGDLANVTASSFIGNLSGNAATATKATQDGAGNVITSKYVTLDTTQTISGTKTMTGGLNVSGRSAGSGDDEGIVVGFADNGYAGLCLGGAASARSVFYFKSDGSKPFWRYNNGSTNYDIQHPGKNGTIALTSDFLPISGGTLTGLLNITTNGKTTTFGCQNSGYSHYSTNADTGHWFNKNTYVQGNIYAGSSYNKLVLTEENYTNYAPTKTGSGASGTWGINVTGSSGSTNYLNINNTANLSNGLQYVQASAQTSGNDLPTNTWWHVIKMNHGQGDTYYKRLLAFDFWNDNIMTSGAAGDGAVRSWKQVWVEGNSVTSAVWNDYAECRESDCEEFGYVLMETGDDSLTKTTERLSHFAGVSSDTWGFSQGETARARTPIAVAGRVLVYPYQDRNNYKPGDCVCAAPNGTVDIMTREEVREWPDRIVGTVSCVPEYEEWGGGEGADRDPVKVNGRIWIKVK